MKFSIFTLLFTMFCLSAYSQCSSGDCKNGFAIYKWSDGDSYEGEWKAGKFHGEGKYVYANGSTFVGSYQNGKKHGQGVYTKANGNKYEGTWELGKRALKNNTTKKTWLPGKWEGKGYQDNGATWQVVLNYVSKDEIKISYPSFPCSGTWVFEKENKTQIFFIEKITKGQSKCRPGNRILIEKAYKDHDDIMGVYFFQGKTQVASANIVKQ
ncbi:MAG: hypothetical protein KUG68_00380 [Flavobacteriaceae bacterium]|nr:hypothetical protein [Flavobacteriaceae bacterium]